MQISRKQVDGFNEEAAKKFEDHTTEKIRDYMPVEFKKHGEEKVRDMIRIGLANAPQYGLTRERDVARYVILMVATVPDFDTNEETSYWSQPVLSDESLDPEEKLKNLFEAAHRS